MTHRFGRGAIAAVAAGLLVIAGCGESSDSAGTFVGDSPTSESPSDVPASPSDAPASPSDAPASPSDEPHASPSDELPASPSEQPSSQDDAGGTTVEIGAKAWPDETVGMDTTTAEWIRGFGIEGLVYPAGDEVQLLEIMVYTLADSQDRSASLFYDLYTDQSAADIAAAFEQVIDPLGDYTFSDRTEGQSLVLTASGTGLSDRYEITVRSEPDQDRYTVQVVRNWSAANDAVPAPVADPIQPAIDVADSVDFGPAGWRYYEHLDYDAYNKSGRIVFAKQVDYHFATPNNNAAQNADRLINAAGGATNRKTQANGVVFTAKGAKCITYNVGGGNIQFKR